MNGITFLLALIIVPTVFSSPIDDDGFALPKNVSSSRTIHANMDISTSQRQRRIGPCGQFCAFRMCNFNGEPFTLPRAAFSILNGPNTASLPYICKPGANIGQVLGSLPARVFYRGNFVPLSAFFPRGLDTRYTDNFITTRAIPYLPWSGIAPRAARGNQWKFMHDRCMILPITAYQEVDPDTQLVQRRVHTNGDRNNCVAFRTTAPTIHVELLWDSSDDFDLLVEEPDGDIVAHYNWRTEAGRLTGDNNVGFCDTNLKFGRENIVYLPGGPIENGTYTVRARHYQRCERTPAVWRVRVMINGVVVLTKRGVASDNSHVGEEVLRTTFEYQED